MGRKKRGSGRCPKTAAIQGALDLYTGNAGPRDMRRYKKAAASMAKSDKTPACEELLEGDYDEEMVAACVLSIASDLQSCGNKKGKLKQKRWRRCTGDGKDHVKEVNELLDLLPGVDIEAECPNFCRWVDIGCLADETGFSKDVIKSALEDADDVMVSGDYFSLDDSDLCKGKLPGWAWLIIFIVGIIFLLLFLYWLFKMMFGGKTEESGF